MFRRQPCDSFAWAQALWTDGHKQVLLRGRAALLMLHCTLSRTRCISSSIVPLTGEGCWPVGWKPRYMEHKSLEKVGQACPVLQTCKLCCRFYEVIVKFDSWVATTARQPSLEHSDYSSNRVSTRILDLYISLHSQYLNSVTNYKEIEHDKYLSHFLNETLKWIVLGEEKNKKKKPTWSSQKENSNYFLENTPLSCLEITFYLPVNCALPI